MRWLLGLLLVSALCIAGTTFFAFTAHGTPVNLTEHSWIYSSGFMTDQRIYQTESGYHGQKAVTGTRGSGVVSRTIDAQVFGGYGDGTDDMYLNEWGVYQSRSYTQPLTQSDLKNALCVKNYEVGSVYSESYSDLKDLIKDTTIKQDDNVSVYDVHSEVQGTAKVGAIVRGGPGGITAYSMSGTYMGYTNMRNNIETGNASILTLPCP
ncbi:MAG: hypothetical protein GYA39_01525 [Methanothrix sp.]|nr:hypothetical protein [Methanothrix sp.]